MTLKEVQKRVKNLRKTCKILDYRPRNVCASIFTTSQLAQVNSRISSVVHGLSHAELVRCVS